MNKQEAIRHAEAWYLQRYHAMARGHLPTDADRQVLREEQLLCIDLVPEHQAAVIKVLLDLTGEEVALLEEGRPCPRCVRSKKARHEGWLHVWSRWEGRPWGKRREHGV